MNKWPELNTNEIVLADQNRKHMRITLFKRSKKDHMGFIMNL